MNISTVSFRSLAPDAPLVHDDRGTPYSAPQWRDLDLDGVIAQTNSCTTNLLDAERERRFPVLFTGGECPLVRATFKFNQTFDRACVHVRGDGPGPLNFEGRADVVGGVLETGWMASAGPLELAVQKIGVTIGWGVSLDGGSTWSYAGQTFNGMYVSLAPATGNGDTDGKVFESALDIACRSAHGRTTELDALWAIWGEFEAAGGVPTVSRKQADGYGFGDGEVLKFWSEENDEPAYHDALQDRDEVTHLLDPCASAGIPHYNGRGTCSAFAMLLDGCFRAAGIDVGLWSLHKIWSTHVFSPIGGAKARLMVKNWSFAGPGAPVCPATPWTHTTPPRPNPQATMAQGVPGQGVFNPVSAFDSHVVLKVEDEVLDPSYGKRYPTEDAWETGSLAGYMGGCALSGSVERGAIMEGPGRQTTFVDWP